MELPRAVLVDLDDTILDDSSCVEGCWTDACTEADLSLNIDLVRQTIRQYADVWWREPARNRQGRLDLRAATRTIVTDVFRENAWGTEAVAVAIAERYRDLREERARLFPGALQTLEQMRASGVVLGMMTNGSASGQRAKIERFGLAPYFGHIVIEGELGFGKPDRRVFETLLSALGVRAEEAWAVGDNLEFDVLAPMRLGLHGIWVDAAGRGCDGRDEKPHRTVASFSEIASL
jgi:putative hydrolase of the HAD superfamily